MPGQQGMHNFSTILKRLEAVTSRLEDVAVSSSSPAPTSSLRSPTAAAHENLAPTSSAAPPPPPPPPPPAEEAVTPAVKAYQDEIIDGALQEFIEKSNELGGLVQQHSSLLPALCEAQLQFLKLASNHSKPSTPTALGPLLEPQGKAIQAILETKEKLSRSKEGRDWNVCFNVLGEGVPAWGWVQVEPAPAPFVAEMKNAAQFWSDRVVKQYKDTNPTAVAWAKAFAQLLTSLQAYVKQWHTTGVAWNPKGSPAPSSIPSASSSSSAPPPPPTSSRGGAVTAGLKKVDASQMTHKNPDLRSSSVVPDNARKAPPLKPKPGAAPAKKPAKLELEDGNKWMIEYQEDNKNIVIDQTELHQTVHIFNCKNSVVKISGKINAVTMVGCKKTAVVLDSAVSSLSITSSPSFEVQITGQIPTIQVDTTDSGQIYLSKECMNTVEIITSKTSSLNISVPTGQDGDFEEKPVPEQMKSKIVGGKLVTEIIEHAG
ncbi:hypothetical protein I203_105863 [Kwoniella mangroviensis CBS 8507]|uniref:uncharacterized protein n=1 Tax=Kwoniella mangroviensis CBS 8507 TaxID=1296122 RepID=UPI0030458D54